MVRCVNSAMLISGLNWLIRNILMSVGIIGNCVIISWVAMAW